MSYSPEYASQLESSVAFLRHLSRTSPSAQEREQVRRELERAEAELTRAQAALTKATPNA